MELYKNELYKTRPAGKSDKIYAGTITARGNSIHAYYNSPEYKEMGDKIFSVMHNKKRTIWHIQ